MHFSLELSVGSAVLGTVVPLLSTAIIAGVTNNN
jgi:hypothetical protein